MKMKINNNRRKLQFYIFILIGSNENITKNINPGLDDASLFILDSCLAVAQTGQCTKTFLLSK